MRSIFGVVGLLLVIAIIALVARKQLQATGAVPSLRTGAVTAGAGGADPASAPSVRAQSQALQQQVQQDVTRALQAAPARNEAADQ